MQGISWTEVELTGQSNHAGTTPMALRKDPGLVAFQVAAFVRELALELGPPQVGTVGRIELPPNLVNVVPATASITIDIRHTDNDALREAECVAVKTRTLARFEPVVFDDKVVSLVEAAAINQGLSV